MFLKVKKFQFNNMHFYLFTYFYILLLGLVVQIIVIPLTPWHWGDGLLVGGDWVGHHVLAVAHAHDIRQFGWSSWNPRINDEGSAGVAAALYYVFSWESPLVLLPLHSFLFALSAIKIFNFCHSLGIDKKYCLFATAPFFTFMSSTMIWGQISKDIYSLSGFVILCVFWGLLPKKIFEFKDSWSLRYLFSIFCNVFIAAFLIFFVRPHLFEPILLCSALSATICASWIFVSGFIEARSNGCKVLINNIFSIFVIIFVVFLAQILAERFIHFSSEPTVVELNTMSQDDNVTFDDYNAAGLQASNGDFRCSTWVNLGLLPQAVDERISKLACVRSEFIFRYPDAGSFIDEDVEFSSFLEILQYLPRTIQISFFSPFPSQWFAESQSEYGKIMRFVAAIETIIMYVMLIGLLFSILQPVHRLNVFLALCFSVTFVAIHVLAIPNVGTLYRMRYPAMLVWFCLGVYGWVTLLKSFVSYRKRCENK